MIDSGIYRIINRVNGNLYAGSAANLPQRKSNHFCALRKNRHENSHLQRAYNKYGADAFMFETVEKVPDMSNLISKEQYWLDFSKENGATLYNMVFIAGNTLGFRHSPEMRQTFSIQRRGRAPWNKGIPMRSETKIKLRQGHLKAICKRGHIIAEVGRNTQNHCRGCIKNRRRVDKHNA